MGGKSAKPAYTGPRKKVVIVGASFAGDKVAKGLIAADVSGNAVEILFIDRSEHFENFCGNYKMFVDDCFKENSINFQESMAYYGSPNISFKHGKLANVLAAENAIMVEIPGGSPEKVSYDVLVIATGGSYHAPWRSGDDQIATFEERQKECDEFRAKVLASNKILCVGTGSTGCEVAGYTKELYPEKTIGICHKGDVILSSLPGCHDIAEQAFKELEIQVLHNTPYSDELKKDWEVIIDCRGMQFLGPRLFLQGKLQDCVDKRTGQIFVNEFCQMTDKHPLIEKGQPSSPTVYENIFSYGDVCLNRMNEQKSIPAILQYKQIIIDNVYNKAIGQPVRAMLANEISLCIMIPIGKTHGIFKFNKMVKPDPTIFDQKEGMISQENGARSNNKDVILAQQNGVKEFEGFLKLAAGCYRCLPMHISKNRSVINQKNKRDKAEYEKFY